MRLIEQISAALLWGARSVSPTGTYLEGPRELRSEYFAGFFLGWPHPRPLDDRLEIVRSALSGNRRPWTLLPALIGLTAP